MAAKRSANKLYYPIDGLDQNPPPILYHYTSHGGLLGMATHKSLWASSIAYMNDTSEFNHGEAVVRCVLEERRKSAKPDQVEFFEEFDRIPNFFDVTQFYVACLTEEGDLLSQWRGYTPNGNGYSVGFDSRIFSKLATNRPGVEQFKLVKCVYDEDEQMRIAGIALDYVLERWDKRHEDRSVVAPDGTVSASFWLHPPFEYRLGVSFLAPVFKHSAFAEEREWRLILTCDKPACLKFREGRSMITPYLEIDIGRPAKRLKVPAFRSVTVGPCPCPDLAIEAVKRLLPANQIEGAIVKSSSAPYRSW